MKPARNESGLSIPSKKDAKTNYGLEESYTDNDNTHRVALMMIDLVSRH